MWTVRVIHNFDTRKQPLDIRSATADMVKSRWADEEEDAALEAQKKKDKEDKKRAKAEKQRRQEEAAAAAAALRQQQQQQHDNDDNDDNDGNGRPTKRRRLSAGNSNSNTNQQAPAEDAAAARPLLRVHAPSWAPARSIDAFTRLNHIEEGSYGYVSRAREDATGQVVAIKKLKMDHSANTYGFPVTALREIQTLNAANGHRHIVALREVVVGDSVVGDKADVFLVMDFLEHDLKTLIEDMDEPFLPSEVKTLMLQLGSAVEWLHDRWILHVSHPLALLPLLPNNA